MRLRLPQRGYPFVEVGPREILLGEADHTGDYTLPVEPGPKSSFGGIRIEGDRVFDEDHAAVIARFKRGELYDERMVDDLRRAFVATGLFASVGVEPLRTSQPGPGGTEAVDLRVRSAAAPKRSLAAEAGYGTGEGLRLEGSWTHRNLFPPEGALTFRAVAGRRNSGWPRSSAAPTPADATAASSSWRRGRASGATSPTTPPALPCRVGCRATAPRSGASAGPTPMAPSWSTTSETAREDVPASTFFIAAVPLQLGYDRSNDLLDPTDGFRLIGRTSPEVSLRSGTATYVRNLLDATAYKQVSSSVVLAGRARVGSIVGADRSQIAPSRRLYGGGGGSVRGFGFQELGPLDENGERIGGRSIVEFAVEARYRFGNFGVVPFVDVGQAYDGVVPRFSDLRYGVGIGARYHTNFGPIRIDLARPLARRKGEPQVAVYISIGQAF